MTRYVDDPGFYQNEVDNRIADEAKRREGKQNILEGYVKRHAGKRRHRIRNAADAKRAWLAGLAIGLTEEVFTDGGSGRGVALTMGGAESVMDMWSEKWTTVDIYIPFLEDFLRK